MFIPGHSQVEFLQQSQGKTICSYPMALLFYGCEQKPARVVFIFCTWILLWENFRTNPHGSIMPCLELLANCTVEDDRWAHPDKLICVAEIKTDKPVLGAMMGHLHILASFLMQFFKRNFPVSQFLSMMFCSGFSWVAEEQPAPLEIPCPLMHMLCCKTLKPVWAVSST